MLVSVRVAVGLCVSVWFPQTRLGDTLVSYRAGLAMQLWQPPSVCALFGLHPSVELHQNDDHGGELFPTQVTVLYLFPPKVDHNIDRRLTIVCHCTVSLVVMCTVCVCLVECLPQYVPQF